MIQMARVRYTSVGLISSGLRYRRSFVRVAITPVIFAS